MKGLFVVIILFCFAVANVRDCDFVFNCGPLFVVHGCRLILDNLHINCLTLDLACMITVLSLQYQCQLYKL